MYHDVGSALLTLQTLRMCCCSVFANIHLLILSSFLLLGFFFFIFFFVALVFKVNAASFGGIVLIDASHFYAAHFCVFAVRQGLNALGLYLFGNINFGFFGSVGGFVIRSYVCFRLVWWVFCWCGSF
jgi:hypothetical protein